MRVERCDFSGYRIYPSKGKTYVRGDSKVGLGPTSRELVLVDGMKERIWNGIVKECGMTSSAGWTRMDGWREEEEWKRRSSTRRKLTSIDFPIRQLQVRIPLPTEEEPQKDRMDPGLQEVRELEFREGL